MLFWLLIIFLLIGIAITFIGFSDGQDIIGIIGLAISVILAICVICSVIGIVNNHTGVDAKVELNKERYEILCYKLESEKARDEFGLVNKEIVDEIQGWNEDIVYYKAIQDDFWLGIYYPNVYDQFEIIELE